MGSESLECVFGEAFEFFDRLRYNPAMAYLLFTLICIIWGGSFLLMKKAAIAFSFVSIGAWRVTGGAAVLAIIWWLRRERIGWTKRDLGSLAFVVAAGYVWPYSVQPWLISATKNSAFIGMTVSFTPLFTMLVSIPLLGIVPSTRQAIGVLGALGGLALLISDGFSRNISAAHLLLAITVPLGYSLVNTWIRRRLIHVPALTVTFIAMLVATVILQPLAWITPAPIPAGPESLQPAIASLLALGIVGTGLAMFWFNQLIHERGPLFAGMVTNLVPLGAVVWGWCDGEVVTTRQLIALAIIVPMVALVQFGGTAIRK